MRNTGGNFWSLRSADGVARLLARVEQGTQVVVLGREEERLRVEDLSDRLQELLASMGIDDVRLAEDYVSQVRAVVRDELVAVLRLRGAGVETKLQRRRARTKHLGAAGQVARLAQAAQTVGGVVAEEVAGRHG